MRQFLTIEALSNGLSLVQGVPWQVLEGVEGVLAFEYPVDLKIVHKHQILLRICIVLIGSHLVVGVLARLISVAFGGGICLELYM